MAFETLNARVAAIRTSGAAPLIVNVHIPKTAGSTLRHQLVKHIPIFRVDPVENFVDYYADLGNRLSDVIPVMRRQSATMFASGHYRFRDARTVLAPIKFQTLMIAFLRDPVKRFLSDYFYSISDANLTHKAMRERYPTVESYMSAGGQLNKQLEYMRPFEGASVGATVDALCAEMGLVGITENYESHADYFFQAFGIPRKPDEKLNIGKDQEAMNDAYLRYQDMLSTAQEYEIDLYDEMRKRTDWIV